MNDSVEDVTSTAGTSMRYRTMFEIAALALAIAAILSLVSSTVGALDAVSRQQGSTGDQRLLWVSRVLGTQFAVLPALLGLGFLALSRWSKEEPDGRSETRSIAVLVFAGINGIAVLLASLHAIIRVVVSPDNGILSQSTGGSRFASLAAYCAAVVMATATLWIAGRLWSNTGEPSDTVVLTESEADTEIPSTSGTA